MPPTPRKQAAGRAVHGGLERKAHAQGKAVRDSKRISRVSSIALVSSASQAGSIGVQLHMVLCHMG